MKRILRRLRTILLLALALVVVSAGYLTLTSPGRSNLASIISGLASGDGRTVRISGLSGIWSGPLMVENVIVEDAKGPWLALRDVSAGISRSALLGMTVKADRISAGRIEVARTPESSATTKPSSSGGFSLPVNIDIAAIDLPDIALGDGLVAGGASLAVSGRAVADGSPLKFDAQLDARRTDQPGELSATVVFAPAEDRLDLRIEGNEPAGGVVASLLKLPGAPPVSIAVEGSGPVSDWKAQGAVAVDEQVAARLSGRHALVDGASRIEFGGEGEFARFLPENLRGLVEGTTVISFAGTLGEGGAVDVEQASLASPALDVKASGRIDPNAQSDFSLVAQPQGGPVTLAFGEGEGKVTVVFSGAEASVRGEGAKPAVDFSASIASVEHAQGAARSLGIDVTSPGFDIGSLTGPVELHASAGALSSPNETLAPLLEGQAAISAKADVGADTIRVSEARLANDALDATASGTVARGDMSAAFDVAAKLRRAALPASVHGVTGETVDLKLNVARGGAGDLTVSGIDIASGPLALKGDAALKDGSVDAGITGTLADLAGLSDQVSGAVNFGVEADGPLLAPNVRLNLSGDRIESGGRAITGLKLNATGTADMANPAADVTLSGKVGDETLQGAMRLATRDGRRQVSRLDLSLGKNRLTGDLDLDDSFLPAGDVTFDLPDLGPLAALALQQVTGSASGKVSFAAGANGPSVKLDATIPAFAREAVTGKDIRIEADVQDYVAAPSVAGRIQVAEVNAGAAISSVDVRLSRDGVWTAFDGGATANGIPATARGRAKYENGAATVELDAGGATVQGVAAQIADRSVIVNENGVTRIENLTLGLGGGKAVVTGTAGDTLAIDVNLANVPASLANNFSPGLGASGQVNGTVRVTGTPSAPSVAYDARLTGAQIAQTQSAGLGAMTIVSNGNFSGGTLRFDATLNEGSGLDLRAGGSVATGGATTLDVNANGRVPFGFLSRTLAEQGMALTGAADVQISVTGTANAPVIGGRVQSSGGRFVDAGSGIAVTDLATTVELGGGVARITSLTGKISSGGSISASGTVGIDPASGFPADLAIKVADGRYTDGRVVTTSFGGDLTITGPLTSAAVIGGRVTLGRSVITIPEKVASSLARLNVQHRNASGEVARQAEALKPASASGGGGGGIQLDVTVSAPQQIFVRGRGLNAELGGNLKLVGPASAPTATGLFEMRRGRMDLLGRRLDFDEGNIGFAGSLVPELDFSATSTIESGTVTLTVTGEASNPKFGFTSSPTLPEDEIFAQLVFGRAMGNLSPLQIAQLASAAATLAGIGGSTSLLDNLQSKLGVDDLDVKTDAETGDTSVSVGKYLNDKTYITIEKGSQPGSGKAAINLDVGRGLKLRGEAADDGSTKGGVYFEREY